MSEYIEGDDLQERDEMIDDRNTTSIEAIKARIAAINSLPLDERSGEYEAVHASLQRALAEIDGI
jgi:guanylate kinase